MLINNGGNDDRESVSCELQSRFGDTSIPSCMRETSCDLTNSTGIFSVNVLSAPLLEIHSG